MLEYLHVIAGSWPIAIMVVGLGTAVVVRQSFKQLMNNSRAAQIDRAQGNNAVVVQRKDY